MDTFDYVLSSSDDDSPENKSQIRVARDKSEYDKLSDDVCKTSDITKVSHVRDVGGIVHERAMSRDQSPRRLDTRSELASLSVSLPQEYPIVSSRT